MSTATAASALGLRPRALTAVLFESVDEDGHDGCHGRIPVSQARHPYCFVSRDAAARFGRWHYAQGLCDGFEIATPGYEPPERPPFIDLDELPF